MLYVEIILGYSLYLTKRLAVFCQQEADFYNVKTVARGILRMLHSKNYLFTMASYFAKLTLATSLKTYFELL